MSSDRFTKTRDAARGRWRGILIQFGVDEAFLKNEHGPCPMCGGKDRFRFDDRDGDGTWYCNGCNPSAGSGLALLMRIKGWAFDRAAKEVDGILGTVQAQRQETRRQEQDTRRLLIKLWKEARPVENGDPVWRYLMRRCGDATGLLESIRFHPSLKHSVDGGNHPAMLALLQPNEGKAVGIHRTFLTEDGMKAAVDPVRMVLGECAPVRLGGVRERLGVAEGIETALCASKAFQVPCWAALNANGMKTWEPPQGVTSVVIFGDNDSNLTGQEAAYALGRRLIHKGLRVQIEIPPTPDTDWADVQLERVS